MDFKVNDRCRIVIDGTKYGDGTVTAVDHDNSEPYAVQLDGRENLGPVPVKAGYMFPIPTPLDYVMRLHEHIDKGRLKVHEHAVPIIAYCAMIDPDAFIDKIDQLCRNPRDEIELFPDGLPQELSFGIFWRKREELFAAEPGRDAVYTAPKTGASPWMVGGLIYRGPLRNPCYEKHEWSVHT